MDIAQHLAAHANVGEVLVSNSTHDLLSGAGIAVRKRDQGTPEIAGVSEVFQVSCISEGVKG